MSSTGRVRSFSSNEQFAFSWVCFHSSASEYRSWLLYFTLPVLHGIFPDPFFSHYTLLVAATHIFLSESISSSALRCAEQYLHRFYGMFANLYGRCGVYDFYIYAHKHIFTRTMYVQVHVQVVYVVSICFHVCCVMLTCFTGENGCTMNVHLLRHLPVCVRNWGPLWAYSCFPFESMNGHLKIHFHGTRCIGLLVCTIHSCMFSECVFLLAGIFICHASSTAKKFNGNHCQH